ncbi:MAG: alpha/beta fold hydrolase [Pseudomonadota bacterium]
MMKTSNNPKITLYCLPFAGGHTLSYQNFQANVAENILIKPLELPGRGKRIREPLLTNLEAMADDVFQQVISDFNGQLYAIFGHSMGATLGYLLTKRLLNAGKPAPLHLFVSGRKAPSVVDDAPPKYQLPKQEFINQLNELGGLPPELLEDTEVMDFLEPILRADFQAIETYIYQPTSPFDIPISILHGLADKEVAYQDLLPWQQESRQPIAIKTFSGGHFFIFEHLFQLGQLFSRTLTC